MTDRCDDVAFVHRNPLDQAVICVTSTVYRAISRDAHPIQLDVTYGHNVTGRNGDLSLFCESYKVSNVLLILYTTKVTNQGSR